MRDILPSNHLSEALRIENADITGFDGLYFFQASWSYIKFPWKKIFSGLNFIFSKRFLGHALTLSEIGPNLRGRLHI